MSIATKKKNDGSPMAAAALKPGAESNQCYVWRWRIQEQCQVYWRQGNRMAAETLSFQLPQARCKALPGLGALGNPESSACLLRGGACRNTATGQAPKPLSTQQQHSSRNVA
jgi:hypothetical protein